MKIRTAAANCRHLLVRKAKGVTKANKKGAIGIPGQKENAHRQCSGTHFYQNDVPENAREATRNIILNITG